MLRSSLRWGEIASTAARAEISRKTLWHLQRIDVDPLPRLPTPEVAQRVVRALHLPRGQQEDLLQHLVLAREALYPAARLSPTDLDWLRTHALWELSRLHTLATFSSSTQQAHHYYQASIDLSRALLPQYTRLEMFTAAAQVHLLMHDALTVVDRPGPALYHVKRALASLDSADPANLTYLEPVSGHEVQVDYYDLRVNVLRSEAVSYNSLGLHSNAVVLCDKALREEGTRRKPEEWKPHILRDKVNALSGSRHALMSDVLATAREAHALTERHDKHLLRLLVDEVLARGYLRREKPAEAGRLLVPALESIGRVQQHDSVGRLHHAMLLRTLAHYYYQLGDESTERQVTSQALSIAESAGLLKLQRELSGPVSASLG